MIINASERFTWIFHGDVKDRDGRAVRGLAEPSQFSQRWTVYVCSTCKTETGFEWSDFYRHVGAQQSNLKPVDRQAIELEHVPPTTHENSFLDFYCSGCGRVVRVHYWYEPPEERAHMEWVELRTIAELECSLT
jgi:hypothetical protein